MAAGQWDPTALPKRPGIYINFKEAAAAQINGGARGTVAIPLLSYANTATAKTFYTVATEAEAAAQFGLANIDSILLALQGGARDVLVYTMPTAPVEQDYVDMREAFDTRPFNVFVFDGESDPDQQAATKTWVKRNREEGKHFFVVIGGDATSDADPAAGIARTTLNSDDYIVNVTVGGVIGTETYTSAEYAPWVAGDIAGTPINDSITYDPAPLEDVNKRLTNAQITTALEAGSLLLVHDGAKVKIESGVTTSGKKIRNIRARQAIATDITRTATDNYIGKLNNNAAGQATLMIAIKAYLETLEDEGVLNLPQVALDPNRPSVGDSVFLTISYVEVDSIERIFLTINI
jgi:hypothetical protein